MKNLFINKESNLLRAGWRILLFGVIFMALNAGLMFGVRSVLGSLPAKGTLWFLLLGLAATTASFITARYLCRQPFVSLGLRRSYAVQDLLMGILISAVLMGLMYATLLGLGFIEFAGFSWWHDEAHTLSDFTSASVIAGLAMLFQFTVVAWWEEIAFRGIVLQNIAKGLSLKWGVVLSTLAFGAIHAGNPNATVLSTFLIIIVTLKLVYAYLKSGQLWLPIGLHLGWNFFQASVFGFASSGHVSPSLMTLTPVAPDWLSGGPFGAENSIFIIPAILGSFYMMHFWVKHSRGLKGHKVTDLVVTEDDFR